MKTIIRIFSITLLMISATTYAQKTNGTKANKKTITILNIDAKGVGMDPSQAGNLVRLELEKLDTFEVMDRYDVAYMIDKNQLNISNCYGKLCLVETGKTIKSEKMFTGSIELYTETIVITLRQIDVANAVVEKTQVKEFLNLPKDLQAMIGITIREMYGLKNDGDLLIRLTKKFNYENLTNNPNQERVNLNGPRMGFTYVFGESVKRLSDSQRNGGYEIKTPIMFQFGYQVEQQYLNEGNFQALFEFIPMITGLDKGMIVPSLTVMNGLRNNRWGWEFAFGPTISLVQKSDGFYDPNGKWRREVDGREDLPVDYKPEIVSEIDSRGITHLSTGFIFAVGKTFKSGKLNIPFNAYVIPGNKDWRIGFSFGFNAKNK